MKTSGDSPTPAALAGTLLTECLLEAPIDAADSVSTVPLYLPVLNAAQARAVRASARRSTVSPLLRAEALALLRHGPGLADLAVGGYHRGMLLDLAARMALPQAMALAGTWPAGLPEAVRAARLEAIAEVELFAEEFACLGPSVSAWIDAERLEAVAAGDPGRRRQLVNAMRWLRLHEVVSNHWIAETMFPRVVRPVSAATLVWSVGAPLTVDRLNDIVEVDALVTLDELEGANSAAQRRRRAAERVRQRLSQGLRVGCVGNHTTVESREALLEAARAIGATSVAVYFDLSEEEVERRNAEAGWPVPRRVIDRALESLEAPRPHEAELVWVVDEQGPVARWDLGLEADAGFVETLLPGGAGPGSSEPS